MQPDIQTQRVEEEYVDELTGEILDKMVTGRLVTKDLPEICRILRGIQYKRKYYDNYLRQEIERVSAWVESKTLGLMAQEEQYLRAAEVLLVSSGERRLAYPGLGVVRFVKGRESVNTEKWELLDKTRRVELANVNQGAFRIETIINPDKKAILQRLKEGDTTTVPLATAFAIDVAPDRFEYKED